MCGTRANSERMYHGGSGFDSLLVYRWGVNSFLVRENENAEPVSIYHFIVVSIDS